MTPDAVTLASRRSIAAGSKSFGLASQLLDPRTRESAHNFYAWCRHCDDVIDGQVAGLGHTEDDVPADERLATLERDTRAALAGRICSDPAFEALARLARQHELPHHIPLDILEGFRMDVVGRPYRTLDDLFDYCYGVAGAVGVGMAIVMGVARDDQATLDRACDLGLAFQLTNIARDVMEDARAGRLYIPDEIFGREGVGPAFVLDRSNHRAVLAAVHEVLAIAEHYYASARIGVAALPWRSAWAIATALEIYRGIGRRIVRRRDPWAERQSVPRWRKVVYIAAGAAPVLGRSGWSRNPPRTGLWTRALSAGAISRPAIHAVTLSHGAIARGG